MQQFGICPQRAVGKEWAAQGMSSLQVSPLVFHTCAYVGCFGKCVEQGPKSPQLARASHFHPPWPRCPVQMSEHNVPGGETCVKSEWLTGAWPLVVQLEYFFGPCEIVASYLCSFFLKWNAQWWCQWLIITFCDWEYRFHCKINTDVNCSIFM